MMTDPIAVAQRFARGFDRGADWRTYGHMVRNISLSISTTRYMISSKSEAISAGARFNGLSDSAMRAELRRSEKLMDRLQEEYAIIANIGVAMALLEHQLDATEYDNERPVMVISPYASASSDTIIEEAIADLWKGVGEQLASAALCIHTEDLQFPQWGRTFESMLYDAEEYKDKELGDSFLRLCFDGENYIYISRIISPRDHGAYFLVSEFGLFELRQLAASAKKVTVH